MIQNYIIWKQIWTKKIGPILSANLNLVSAWIRVFSSVARQPNSGQSLTFLDHRHKYPGPPLNERSTRRRGRYLPDTQLTQQKDIHALSGIQTHDPNSWEASELRHWPCGVEVGYDLRTCSVDVLAIGCYRQRPSTEIHVSSLFLREA